MLQEVSKNSLRSHQNIQSTKGENLEELLQKFVKGQQEAKKIQSARFLQINDRVGSHQKISVAVKKVKNKLQIEDASKESKFSEKLNQFRKLKTFVDAKQLISQYERHQNNKLQSARTQEIVKYKSQSPNHSQSLSSSSSEQFYLLDYQDLIDRTKRFISNKQEQYDKLLRIRRKQNSQIEIMFDQQEVEIFDEESTAIDEQRFYSQIDKILKRQSLVDSVQQKPLPQPPNDQPYQLDKLNGFISSNREDQEFKNKSNKVLRLLEKTTKMIFNKRGSVNISKFKPQDESPSLSVRKFNTLNKRESNHVTNHSQHEKSSDLKSVKYLQRRYNKSLPQSTKEDVDTFQKIIKSNSTLDKGLSLQRIMDLKSFAFDNHEALQAISTPQIGKSIQHLYSINQRVKTDVLSSDKPFKTDQTQYKELKTSTFKETTNPQLVYQRDRIRRLINVASTAQSTFQLENPKLKQQLEKMSKHIQNNMKVAGGERVESLYQLSPIKKHYPSKYINSKSRKLV